MNPLVAFRVVNQDVFIIHARQPSADVKLGSPGSARFASTITVFDQPLKATFGSLNRCSRVASFATSYAFTCNPGELFPDAEMILSGISTMTANRGRPSVEPNLSRAGTSMRYIRLMKRSVSPAHPAGNTYSFALTEVSSAMQLYTQWPPQKNQ